MGTGKLLVNIASIAVTLGLAASLLQLKVTSNPCLLKAVKGAKPPGAAGAPPSAIAGPPIIADIASMAGGAGAGVGAGPDPRRSISIESMPPAPGGGAAGCAAAVAVGGGVGAEVPRMSESRSISWAGGGCAAAATSVGGADGVDPSAALLDSSSPAEKLACTAGVRSFLAKAGMRSSTPARMLSSRRRLVYSTDRCCSSRDIEAE
mmetsp:Transcript_21823/g.50176  ORF Transcript_21823/g.50176 Transcript_21823/m.50176 type:complete len:206 (-) Transcript_21823:1728-2345(-)